MNRLLYYLKFGLIFLLILIPGAPFFMKWSAIRKARRHIGEDVSGFTHAIVRPDQDVQSKIYYFTASYCGPCKAMAPMIDQLQQSYPGLIKVDIEEQPELAEGFGVMATPTFVVVKNNQVAEVKVGSSGPKWLKARLDGEG